MGRCDSPCLRSDLASCWLQSLVLSDPLGILILLPLTLLVLVDAVAFYAMGKTLDADE